MAPSLSLAYNCHSLPAPSPTRHPHHHPAGLFFPFAKGDLPTFNARGQVSLFLNGMFSEHAGTFLIPVFPAFKPGPGPAPALPGGLLFSW